MNNIERAFYAGFMKAAFNLTSAPIKSAIPALQAPKLGPQVHMPVIQPNTGIENLAKHAPINIPKPNNYTFNILNRPGNWTRYDKQTGNTLNINAHGGASTDGRFEFAGSEYDITGVPPEDIAKQIGPSTNKINNIYSTACNAGVWRGTQSRDPNAISPGFETPAMFRSMYPNVTNVVQVPPGYDGVDFNTNKIDNSLKSRSNLISKHNLKTIDEKSNNEYYLGDLESLPHQYQLQGGTNWVDRGIYNDY